ncbi:conserved Plasmodium protein, unknown function [Plasmodium berghei]|uniref:Uncharacterized protein n=1 Tax=Plasmodium berghei TaxID=5821 RepID=A0A113RX46_PLABE|nr:conserved Plasmodium protein, unknown function [Plasmodium berghei]
MENLIINENKENENQIIENVSLECNDKHKIKCLYHNDIVFYKHREKNKIGIGRVVNFRTELSANDIHLVSDHNITLLNSLKILNNINNTKYVQNYISKLTNKNDRRRRKREKIISENTIDNNNNDNNKSCSNSSNNTNVININNEKKELSITKYFIKNDDDNENDNETDDVSLKNNTHDSIGVESVNGITKDTVSEDNNNYASTGNNNSSPNDITKYNKKIYGLTERKKSGKMFYIVQSFGTYKYLLQYKKFYAHYKMFVHKKWKNVKVRFCKNIQNKISFVLAMKVFEIKKLYYNNINLQNFMINNLMKIYKSEKDLHIDNNILSYIHNVDVRVILQNNVLITNDDFNDVISKNKKNNANTKKKMCLSNEENAKSLSNTML